MCVGGGGYQPKVNRRGVLHWGCCEARNPHYARTYARTGTYVPHHPEKGHTGAMPWQVRPLASRVCVCVCEWQYVTVRGSLGPWGLGCAFVSAHVCTRYVCRRGG